MLPFLEEQTLYDQFDFSRGVVTEPNFPAISHVLPVFQCPSTPGYPRTTLQVKYDPNKKAEPYDFSVGAYDYGIPARTWGQRNENGEDGYYVPAWMGSKYPLGTDKQFGAACGLELDWGRGAKLVWITDGLSNTTVAHEVAYQPNLIDHIDGINAWVDGRVQNIGNTKLNSFGFGWAQIYSFEPHAGRPINSTNHASRFSFHPGGVNNAFLDGSVRFLEESTDLFVLRDLVSRAGEEGATSVFD